MLEYNPIFRPSAEQLLSLPIFDKIRVLRGEEAIRNQEAKVTLNHPITTEDTDDLT